MDKHYLTPLFAPQSIIVLAGDPETPDAQTPYAQALHGLLNHAVETDRRLQAMSARLEAAGVKPDPATHAADDFDAASLSRDDFDASSLSRRTD